MTFLRRTAITLRDVIPKSHLTIPLLSSFPRTRSLSPPPKESPMTWNTTHPFVLSNPLLSLLEKCKYFSHLMQIQSQMTLTGLISDGFASSRLIAFCVMSESRDLDYCSKLLLYATQNPTSFSWNVAIKGYLEGGNPKECIVLYKKMLRNMRCRPDNYTYPLLFKFCGDLGLIYMGFQVIGHVLKLGFDEDVFVRNALMQMFILNGDLDLARKVFDKSCVRDLVSWNSLINGYARSGQAGEALRIYEEMMMEEVNPDEVTMVGLVSSCAQLQDLKLGREFHLCVERRGLKLTVSLANALMDMYVKCGDLEPANVIFEKMKEKTVVSWTTMIVGYAKRGLFDSARKVFNDMPEKNVVTWNAMIGGYVQVKRGKDALVLFHEMQSSNVKPDEVTMVHCLSACTQLGALAFGMWIHHYIRMHNFPLDVALGTALIDMYAKCGNIKNALQVFHEMPGRNTLTWTTIIGGLALHGKARDAISYFSKMIDVGLMPDEITFLSVLSACCHGRLVHEGRKYFSQMKSKFSLSPQLKHYSCMVDLLGRAGLLKEAEELIISMPMEADAVVWGALFFACKIHGNLLMGERVALKLLELDPYDSGIYVLLANMYKEANMEGEAGKVRKMMMERGVEKTPGSSLIEIDGYVHEFIARDTSHLHSERIYECLIWLTSELEYVSCIDDFSNFDYDTSLDFEVGDQRHCQNGMHIRWKLPVSVGGN